MKLFLPYINQAVNQSSETTESINQDHLFSKEVYDKVVSFLRRRLFQKIWKILKNVVEFSFTPTVSYGWKIVERQENYTNRRLSFTDSFGELQEKNISYLIFFIPRLHLVV